MVGVTQNRRCAPSTPRKTIESRESAVRSQNPEIELFCQMGVRNKIYASHLWVRKKI